MNVAPRISPKMSGKSPSLASSSLSSSVVAVLARASACSTITSKFARTLASSVSAKQEEGRRAEGPGEALRYDAWLCVGKSIPRPNDSGIEAEATEPGMAPVDVLGDSKRLATPLSSPAPRPLIMSLQTSDKTAGSRRACTRGSLLTRMTDVNSAADEIISRRPRANQSGTHGWAVPCTDKWVWGHAAAEGFSPTPPRAHWIRPEFHGFQEGSPRSPLGNLNTFPGLSACKGKANRIPIIAECASSTPLETLTPDVIFILNEIEILKGSPQSSSKPLSRAENIHLYVRFSRSLISPVHLSSLIARSRLGLQWL